MPRPPLDAEAIESLTIRAGLPPTPERLVALAGVAPFVDAMLAAIWKRASPPGVEPAVIFLAEPTGEDGN